MVELLDLRSVLLVIGDFDEYTRPRVKDSTVYTTDIFVFKNKLTEKDVACIQLSPIDGKSYHHLQLYQVNDHKIYLIVDAVGESRQNLTCGLPIEALYSDSILDAKKHFKSVLNQHREKLKK